MKEKTIVSRKQAYPALFNGSMKKHNPGDRGGDIKKSYRYGRSIRTEDFLYYMNLKNLTQKNVQDILYPRSRSAIQGYCGKGRKGHNNPISKNDFWKIVEATEPTEWFEWFNNMIGNIDEADPFEIMGLIRQISPHT